MTQAELSQATGLHLIEIPKLERGFRKSPGVETLMALAEALDVEIGALLTLPIARQKLAVDGPQGQLPDCGQRLDGRQVAAVGRTTGAARLTAGLSELSRVE
jgi:transcriptional regulator with XRE-family HTH domain